MSRFGVRRLPELSILGRVRAQERRVCVSVLECAQRVHLKASLALTWERVRLRGALQAAGEVVWRCGAVMQRVRPLIRAEPRRER